MSKAYKCPNCGRPLEYERTPAALTDNVEDSCYWECKTCFNVLEDRDGKPYPYEENEDD